MNQLSKVFTLAISVSILLGVAAPSQSDAQAVRLLASNTISGAATGASLGFANMALRNEENWDALRFGVGLGTIGGLGVGVYDILMISGGDDYYVEGIFTSANGSTTIILMDTFYGAVAGSVVGGAITLMTGDPILKGLQYGAGAGAWVGFGFGIIDAFIFSAHVPYDDFFNDFASNTPTARGFISYTPSNSFSLGMISPAVFSYKDLSDLTEVNKFSTGLEVANLKLSF